VSGTIHVAIHILFKIIHIKLRMVLLLIFRSEDKESSYTEEDYTDSMWQGCN
jgi:hypothetical protein